MSVASISTATTVEELRAEFTAKTGLPAPSMSVHYMRKMVMAARRGKKDFPRKTSKVPTLTLSLEDARHILDAVSHPKKTSSERSAVLEKIPFKAMMHMVLTREEIDGNAALRLGLVSQVAPRAGLDAALAATLAKLTDRDRSALCAVKEYQNAAWNLDATAAARLGAGIIGTVLASQAGH